MKNEFKTFFDLELKSGLKRVFELIPESTRTNLEKSGVTEKMKKFYEEREKKVKDFAQKIKEEELSYLKESFSPEMVEKVENWINDCPLFKSEETPTEEKKSKIIDKKLLEFLEFQLGDSKNALAYLMGIEYALNAKSKEEFTEGIYIDLSTHPHFYNDVVESINSYLNS